MGKGKVIVCPICQNEEHLMRWGTNVTTICTKCGLKKVWVGGKHDVWGFDRPWIKSWSMRLHAADDDHFCSAAEYRLSGGWDGGNEDVLRFTDEEAECKHAVIKKKWKEANSDSNDWVMKEVDGLSSLKIPVWGKCHKHPKSSDQLKGDTEKKAPAYDRDIMREFVKLATIREGARIEICRLQSDSFGDGTTFYKAPAEIEGKFVNLNFRYSQPTQMLVSWWSHGERKSRNNFIGAKSEWRSEGSVDLALDYLDDLLKAIAPAEEKKVPSYDKDSMYEDVKLALLQVCALSVARKKYEDESSFSRFNTKEFVKLGVQLCFEGLDDDGDLRWWWSTGKISLLSGGWFSGAQQKQILKGKFPSHVDYVLYKLNELFESMHADD